MPTKPPPRVPRKKTVCLYLDTALDAQLRAYTPRGMHLSFVAAELIRAGLVALGGKVYAPKAER